MMMIWLALALAQDPLDVREDIGGGAVVNWTTLTLEVLNSAQGRGVGATRKVVEASARTGLGAQVHSAVGGVHVARDVDVNHLLRDPELADAVEARAGRWAVGETRYYASGRIEVIAELDLLDLLKPYNVHRAHPRPQQVREPAVTGVVIDARGTGAIPTWAPIIVSPGERVLWDGALWADIAVSATPVVWLSDPAHPAIIGVGQNPMIVRAESSAEGTIVLEALEAVRFRTALEGSGVLRSGAVAIIVGP